MNARIGWKALTAYEYVPEGYAFLATPNIKSDEIDFENVNFITEFRYEESPELKLQVGDVLLVKDGNTLGITNVIRDLPRPATVNGSIAVIRPRTMFPAFLRYVLASDFLQGRIAAYRAGMGVPHLFQADIKKFPLPQPRMSRQRAIADYLDAETTRIDAVIRRRAEQRHLLDEREFAYLSGSLVPEGTPFAPVRFAATIQAGLTVDAQRDPGPDAVTRPYLRVANVQAGSLALESVTEITVPRSLAERCTLRVGDVLMTEGGDLDKLGRGTVWRGELDGALHQNHIFAVRPDPERLSPKYLALLTRTAHARAYFERTGTKTTNLASTNSEKILGLPVPVLTLPEQQLLVKLAEHEIDQIGVLRNSLDRQARLLSERRQALITAAVTGQLEIAGVAA